MTVTKVGSLSAYGLPGPVWPRLWRRAVAFLCLPAACPRQLGQMSSNSGMTSNRVFGNGKIKLFVVCLGPIYWHGTSRRWSQKSLWLPRTGSTGGPLVLLPRTLWICARLCILCTPVLRFLCLASFASEVLFPPISSSCFIVLPIDAPGGLAAPGRQPFLYVLYVYMIMCMYYTILSIYNITYSYDHQHDRRHLKNINHMEKLLRQVLLKNRLTVRILTRLWSSSIWVCLKIGATIYR